MSLAETAEECAQEVVGRTKMTGGFVWNHRFGNIGSVDFNTVFSQVIYSSTKVTQNAEQDRNVTDVWYILDDAAVFRKDGGRDDSNDCIFCTADLHFTVQAVTAFNDVFFQNGSPLTLFYLGCVKGTIESFKISKIVYHSRSQLTAEISA